MKTRNLHARRRLPSCFAIVATAAILATGCTNVARQRTRARSDLDEHSRALTTAVVESLQRQPELERDTSSVLALQLARADQRIEGLPLEEIPVEALMAGDSQATQGLAGRFTDIEKLLRRERKSSERLLEFGERYEQHRNAQRVNWAKWIGGGSVLIGSVVVLAVCVPAALPIVGRVLAWFVTKIPSLAGTLGVVGVRAFDSVMRGIERTKSEAPAAAGLSNALPGGGNWVDTLHRNLSREMDASHKALIRARKANLHSPEVP